MDDTEAKQRAHYNKIAAAYEQHYSDHWSTLYRQEFLYNPMFQGINLNGASVLDAMCGSGQTTQFLLLAGAKVTGLDISDRSLRMYAHSWPSCSVVCASLLNSALISSSFDCVVIIGGLHHLHPHVSKGIDEVLRILKPGGYFCFMEPHAGSLPNVIRKLWYRCDSLFEENEAPVDVATLQEHYKDQFDYIITRYIGGIAYLFVLNSLVFRIPWGLKRFYAPLLLAMERSLQWLHSKTFSCVVISQWQKRESKL